MKLDTPEDIYPVFYIDLVRPAVSDLFSIQIVDNSRSSPIEIDSKLEWQINEILEIYTKYKKH